MNFIIFWNLTSNLKLHEPFWTQDNLTKTELIYQPNSSKILNFEPYELGLTQTLYSYIVDVISKQQIMNESARGKKVVLLAVVAAATLLDKFYCWIHRIKGLLIRQLCFDWKIWCSIIFSLLSACHSWDEKICLNHAQTTN